MRYFIVLIILSIFIYGCGKKEIPSLVEIPSYEISTNKSSIKKTVNNQTQEKSPEQTISEIFLPENLNKTEKEDWNYWQLYGRGTKPFLAIFFDYDDYSIRKDMWDRIKQNVEYLLEHPEIKVQLQGNCDERGTNEYNMALGAKRALEVKKMLIKLGVNKNRISTISFGEERPLAKCHNETCWAINRRVDFVRLK